MLTVFTTTFINPTAVFILCIITLGTVTLFFKRVGYLESIWMASHALMLKFALSKWTCAVLMVAAALAVGSRAYLSYLAPGDILQNTISAREFALGHSLYPSKLNELVLADLHDHPPAEPLSNHVARLKNLQRDQFAVSRLNMVNAHPPLFSLLLVPVVQVVGIYFPTILVNAVALVLYGYVVHQLATTLFPHLNHRWQLLLLALSLGWQPVLASVRHASQSLIIGSLAVLCWMLIRRHRDILGGAALGVATVLKVYPAVLLAYLIFRRRSAFAAAAAVIALLGAAVWMCIGVSDLYRFAATARTVTETFGEARNNLSLFSLVFGAARLSPSPAMAAAFLMFLGFTFSVGVALLTKAGQSMDALEAYDLEFAIVACGICLLSPIVWAHYYSVLLLPIAVLARQAFAWPEMGLASIGFLILVLVFSLPDQPFLAFSSLLQSQFGRPFGWVLGSLQTMAVLVLMSWLVMLRIRGTASFPVNVSGPVRCLKVGSSANASTNV